MIFSGSLLFLFGLISLSANRFHFLSILLSLELIVLGIFLCVAEFVMGDMMEMLIFYMVLVVSEASLGLGVLVLSVLYYGDDYMKSHNCLSC